jgi:hypothetical protein
VSKCREKGKTVGVLDGFWEVTGLVSALLLLASTLAVALPHMIEPSITKDILTKDNLRVNSEELIGGLELFRREFAFVQTRRLAFIQLLR